jgi:hypothetical protein
MKIPVKTFIPISIHIPTTITLCAFCSFDKCICNLAFQQLVDKDLRGRTQ